MSSLQRVAEAWSEIAHEKQILYLSLAIPLALYFVWRLWTFTIAPALKPNEPPPLPYWIPFVGHAIQMFKDQESLMEHGRTYFGTRPFALTVVGKTLYIQTNLADINATYKAPPESVSFDDAVREIFTSWGVSADGSERMWRPGYAGAGFANPHGKSFGQLSHDIQRGQLETPDGLKVLTDVFQARLAPLLRPAGIPKGCLVGRTEENGTGTGTGVVEGGRDELRADLMRLCWQTLIPAGTETFFGTSLRDACPDLDERFVEFDSDAWKLLMQLPPSMAERCYAGRAVVLDAMGRFVERGASARADACRMVHQLTAEMDSLQMATPDQAIVLFMLYWLINVNSFKLSFWMLARLLFDGDGGSELRRAVLAELRQNVPSAPDAQVDMQKLLNDSPVLNALFDEAQRIYVSTASTRNVMRDTSLNGWTYRGGAKILVPYRQLHFDPAVFGAGVQAFDHTRFLQVKGLSRNAHFKPFGGGNTLCTGRFVARREVLMFVAIILSRWDISLVGNQTFPEVDSTKPGLGVMEPKEGQTVIVRMIPKV